MPLRARVRPSRHRRARGRLGVVLVFILVAVVTVAVRPEVVRIPLQLLKQRLIGRATVADLVAQHGAGARSRLRPRFEAAGVAYPPARVVLVGLKEEKRLEVYAGAAAGPVRLVHTYPILAASGGPGPKLREGDGQVPEGFYRVESLNSNSLYHLSLRLDYPNEFDRQRAAAEGRTRLGGDIMIHGKAASIGCLAMGDEAIEELFVLAADVGVEGFEMVISPADFRVEGTRVDTQGMPAWVDELHGRVRARLAELGGSRE